MKICCMIIIIVLGVLDLVAAMQNLEPFTEKERLLTFALTSIIQKFYSNQSNNIFVTSNRADATHNSILQKMFATFDGSITLNTWILHDKDYLNGNVNRICSIVLIDSYESFRAILESITTTSLERFGFYTIVLTNSYDDQKGFDILTSIFDDFWHNNIVDVNILTYSDTIKSSVLLHTFFPFDPSHHCGEIVPVIWNTLESDDFVETNKETFPLKTQNLNQCPVSILISPLRPYLFITGNNSDASFNYEGIEHNLIQALAEKINFKLNLSIYWDQDLGVMYENLTADRAFGMILERKYDGLVGGFIYHYLLKQIISSTKPYSFDQLILVLPYPRPYTSFETLFFPFTSTMWIFLSITMSTALMLIKLLQCNGIELYEFVVGSKNNSPYFNLLSVVLTGGALYEPKRSFARFILMVWILTCLVLQTVYQGQLFTFIRMNKMAPGVRSIDELVESGFSIKVHETYYGPFLKFDDRVEKLLKYVDPESEWEYVTETEAYVTFETHLADETYQKNSEKIFLPKPKTIKISAKAHVLYLSKRFYLKESLDDEITHMNENGMTAKWDAPYKESAILENVDLNIPRKLKISQILGMIEAWFGLLILATILFVLEILCPNYGLA